MEGQALPLERPVRGCVQLGEDRQGALFQVKVSLEGLSAPDQKIIALFIAKGRGTARLKPLSS